MLDSVPIAMPPSVIGLLCLEVALEFTRVLCCLRRFLCAFFNTEEAWLSLETRLNMMKLDTMMYIYIYICVCNICDHTSALLL